MTPRGRTVSLSGLDDSWTVRSDCVYRNDVYAQLALSSAGEPAFDLPEVPGIDGETDAVRAALAAMTPDGESDDSPLVLASPVFLVSPMPAHVVFPGSLPVPATTPVEPALPVLGTLESANVAVVDTPFVEPGDSSAWVDDPWTHGHSTFMGGVIARIGWGRAHRCVREPTHAGRCTRAEGQLGTMPYIDEVQFGESLRLAASGRKKGVNRVVNLSLGVYPCTVDPQATTVDPDDKGALTLFPVTTVLAVAELSGALVKGAGELALVAAAGNAPEATVTLPAALANVDALLEVRSARGPPSVGCGRMGA